MALSRNRWSCNMFIVSYLVCLWFIPPGSSEISKVQVEEHVVRIGPVVNISVPLLQPTWALVVWDPPIVYPFITGTPQDPNPPPSQIPPSPSPADKNTSSESPSSSPSPAPLPSPAPTDAGHEKFDMNYVDYTAVPDNCRPLETFVNKTMKAMRESKETYEMVVQHFNKMLGGVTWNTTLVKGHEEKLVEFSKGCVRSYTVLYGPASNSSAALSFPKTFPNGARPEVNLTNLEPGIKYNLTISTTYQSGDNITSAIFQFMTPLAGPNRTEVCTCDPFGAAHRNCNKEGLPLCQCNSGYAGVLCEQCAHGYYRTTPYFPCHVCPCHDYNAQIRDCHFREGFLVCERCRTGYTGNLCQQCAYGFYRLRQHCIPCHCNANTAKDAPIMCDHYTGECRYCDRNTTGFNCERCLPGFLGDAVSFKNCTHKSEVGLPGGMSAPAIAGICIGIILGLSAITGAIVYRRWTSFAPFKPFWTVELQEDHEGVSFSPIENMEHADIPTETSIKRTVEDGEYYKLQGGSGTYSPLYEEA